MHYAAAAAERVTAGLVIVDTRFLPSTAEAVITPPNIAPVTPTGCTAGLSASRYWPGVLAVTTGATVPEDPERLVARVVDAYGKVGVLGSNAGQGLHVAIEGEVSTPTTCASFSS